MHKQRAPPMLRCKASQNFRYTSRPSSLAQYSTDAPPGQATRHQLRALLRETAQPVAVVTSFMPHKGGTRYHGATLSSFTSIAMDPYPLVTFALRIPSRMADSLKSSRPEQPSHMVVNLLSAAQESVAIKFSRPDLYPDPFSTTSYLLSKEGLPVLEGSLGALSCQLVSTALPLHDLEYLRKRGAGMEGCVSEVAPLGGGVASELFIARVMRVEPLSLGEDDEGTLRTLPLLYHRRGYTSCQAPHHLIKAT